MDSEKEYVNLTPNNFEEEHLCCAIADKKHQTGGQRKQNPATLLASVSNELETVGWVVIISNDIDNAKEAMRIYREKDVVEKGFPV